MSAGRRTLSLVSLLSVPMLASAQDPKPVNEPVSRSVRPAGPATVTAEVAGPLSFVIRWDSVPGATGYDIGRLAPPNGWQRVGQRVGPNVREIHDGGRTITVPHTYRVIAIVGNLASTPTLSAEVKGVPAQALPGSTNSPVPACQSTADLMYTSCTLKKTWQGVAEDRQGLQVGCPAGSLLLSGGYDIKLKGYQVVRSAPSIHSPTPSWHVMVQRTLSEPVSAAVQQELVVVAVCRRTS